MNINKVVLAYSGGLDTSVIIKWLEEHYQCSIIALSIDLGQNEDFEKLKKKAHSSGAVKVIVEDCRKEFLEDYCFHALAANAIYEGKYLLATALGRPLIAEKLVRLAEQENADAIVHGSTGKGNDQVRFDVSIMALNPNLKIIAPVRTWEFKSREEEIEYAKKHNIPVPVTSKSPYSLDKNLWGMSIECGILEDPWEEPPDDTYFMVNKIDHVPKIPCYMEIEYSKGIPVALDGEKMDCVALVEKLNTVGALYGIGRVDMVENRLVGIKSREVYEAPAATILYHSHRELEALVLDRETAHYKENLSLKYSELVYNGLWFSRLREALDGFMRTSQEAVSGKVRVKLHCGQCTPVGRSSANSLYDFNLATYSKEDAFDHKAGEYFCKVWGLPSKVAGIRDRDMKKEDDE
ncbi:MAG: argininosuccinate synthase [bacterium]